MPLDKCHALRCEPHLIYTIQWRWYAPLQDMTERSRSCVEKPATSFENIRDYFRGIDVADALLFRSC